MCSCPSSVWMGCVMNPVHVVSAMTWISPKDSQVLYALVDTPPGFPDPWHGSGICAWQRQGINQVYQKISEVYNTNWGVKKADYLLPCKRNSPNPACTASTAQPSWPELHYFVLHWTMIQGKAGKHCKHILYTEPMYFLWKMHGLRCLCSVQVDIRCLLRKVWTWLDCFSVFNGHK